MKTDEKHEVIKSVRLTPTQVNQLEKLNVSIRDAVIFYIEHMTPTQVKLMDKRQELENNIHEKQTELNQLNKELQQINEEIIISKDKPTTVNFDIISDANKILEDFKQWRQSEKQTIQNYFTTKEFKKRLNICVIKHGGDTPNLYEENLIDYIINIGVGLNENTKL